MTARIPFPAISRSTVLIAGRNLLASPLAGLLAQAGLANLVILTSVDEGWGSGEARLIERVRLAGTGTGLRFMTLPGSQDQTCLFPPEVDLVIDCLDGSQAHGMLERSCRDQGLPILLAHTDGRSCRVGLLDPYANSLQQLFEGPSFPITAFQSDDQPETGLSPYEEAAVREAGRLALAILAGQFSFFNPTLSHFAPGTEDRSCPPPADLPRYRRLVLVGSDARNLGKTTLCASLAAIFSGRGHPVTVLKVERDRELAEPRLLEETPDSEKQQIRALFEAGARRALRLITPEERFKDALLAAVDELYGSMGFTGLLLLESNTARQFLQPGFFIHLQVEDGPVKPSAVRTRRLADLKLQSPLTPARVDEISEIIDRIVFV